MCRDRFHYIFLIKSRNRSIVNEVLMQSSCHNCRLEMKSLKRLILTDLSTGILRYILFSSRIFVNAKA